MAGRAEIVEPVPADLATIANLASGDVSAMLDTVRDVTSGLLESIEASQATIGAYHNIILEESDGVRIMGEPSTATVGRNKTKRRTMVQPDLPPCDMPATISRSPSVISLHSTGSEAEQHGKRRTGLVRDGLNLDGMGAASNRQEADAQCRNSSIEEWTSEGIDDAGGDGSSDDSDDSVSSGGLTNTSEDSD